MQLVLDTNGLLVKKRNNAFFVIGSGQKRMISPHRIDSIAVTADCLLSSAAIRLAAKNQIPIFFFNAAAQVEARLWSPSFGSIATIRRQQVLFARDIGATSWVIDLFKSKVQHQVKNLQYLSKKRPQFSAKINADIKQIKEHVAGFGAYENVEISACRNQLMGIEGNIARIYWQSLANVFPAEVGFSKRTRRPALDMFNASLNYAYGMLYSVVGSAILAAGLDPHLGFLHVDAHNKPTFTFDLIEPFRPWIDYLLIEAVLETQFRGRYFTGDKESGISLSKEGKKWLIPTVNDFMQERIRFNENRLLSRKNHIYRFSGEFAQFLLKQTL